MARELESSLLAVRGRRLQLWLSEMEESMRALEPVLPSMRSFPDILRGFAVEPCPLILFPGSTGAFGPSLAVELDPNP